MKVAGRWVWLQKYNHVTATACILTASIAGILGVTWCYSSVRRYLWGNWVKVHRKAQNQFLQLHM